MDDLYFSYIHSFRIAIIDYRAKRTVARRRHMISMISNAIGFASR